MQDRRTPGSTMNNQRIGGRLVPRLFRLVGWSAVVGLPTLIAGPRRLIALASRRPVMLGAACLCLLAVAAVWSNSFSGRIDFEMESIDRFDQPSELLADAGPVLLDAALAAGVSFADEADDCAVSCDASSASTPSRQVGAKKQPAADAAGGNRIVWLTGDIEEVPAAEPAGRVRSAVRVPSNKR